MNNIQIKRIEHRLSLMQTRENLSGDTERTVAHLSEMIEAIEKYLKNDLGGIVLIRRCIEGVMDGEEYRNIATVVFDANSIIEEHIDFVGNVAYQLHADNGYFLAEINCLREEGALSKEQWEKVRDILDWMRGNLLVMKKIKKKIEEVMTQEMQKIMH